MLPEIRLKAKKAEGKGGFRRKPGELSGLRSGRWESQAYSVTIFCLDRQGGGVYSPYTSNKLNNMIKRLVLVI
jgi:hypothetical protein